MIFSVTPTLSTFFFLPVSLLSHAPLLLLLHSPFLSNLTFVLLTLPSHFCFHLPSLSFHSLFSASDAFLSLPSSNSTSSSLTPPPDIHTPSPCVHHFLYKVISQIQIQNKPDKLFVTYIFLISHFMAFFKIASLPFCTHPMPVCQIISLLPISAYLPI